MIEVPENVELVKKVTSCRSCGSADLAEVLDLGIHAVSDFYNKVPEDELKVPLILVNCDDCGLIQLMHSVSKERLYKDYWYRSGLNPMMVRALKDVTEDVMRHVDLSGRCRVLDIGANDGTLLDLYPGNVAKYGYEPSSLYQEALGKNQCVYHRFYPEDDPIRAGKFSVITSIAMFYDIDNPHAFVQAIKEDLHPEGVWINQMMGLEDMLWKNAFDNICHEHVAYWSYDDFSHLVSQHDLQIIDSSHNTVNGGSIRCIVKHEKKVVPLETRGWYFVFKSFAKRVALLRGQCIDFLEACRANNKKVIGYGASTKGNTLLQYYNITRDLLPAIADRNPDKIGKITAGSHIPIISEEEMRQQKPDYLLILPWHFLDNFISREAVLRAQGTKFIVPLPVFKVI